jgi:hypothetical protein
MPFSPHPDVNHLLIVSLEPIARQTEKDILILPYGELLQRLWAGEFIENPDHPGQNNNEVFGF